MYPIIGPLVKNWERITIRELVDQEVLDENGNKSLDGEGNPMNRKVSLVRKYRPSFVFVISQTRGKEIKAFCMDFTATVEERTR